jgi:uncharacterized metal-binding protein YceD (DUF177 family)
MSAGWRRLVRLAELAHGPVRLSLVPDAAERAELARELGLEGLPALSAELELRPWLDGVEVTGRFEGQVGQICGVSLDPFEQMVAGEIEARAVPPDSPNAPQLEGGELTLDLDAPDPPDVLETDSVDPTAYLIEHLVLQLDPFPRKPGAAFEFQPADPDDSPFAALRRLKDGDR